jgi:hypothetical protein
VLLNNGISNETCLVVHSGEFGTHFRDLTAQLWRRDDKTDNRRGWEWNICERSEGDKSKKGNTDV